MDKPIRISVESYKLVEKIAKKEQRSRKTVLANAIINFAKSKKVYKEA